jgi:16S rRNA (guanine527-N7)-methyltransferase
VTPPPGLFDHTSVSRESAAKLQSFVNLALDWQPRINLIASSTVAEIWTRHVADSLQLLPLIPPKTTVIADLGSGGGFPGLVLACTVDAVVHLYESNGKKAAFLREALRVSGTKGAVHAVRLETLKSAQDLPPASLVTARALAPLDELLGLAHPFLARGATGLFHKGQNLDVELTQARKSWTITAVAHRSTIDSHSFILEVRNATRDIS